MNQIPTRWPDIEKWFIEFVTTAKIVAADPLLSDAVVRNQKPSATPPYKQVIVAADYGQLLTPVSRYVRLRMQSWVTGTTNDLALSYALADTAAHIAQTAPRDASPVISVEVDAGPSRVKDPVTGFEYQATTLLLEVGRL